MRCPRGHSLGQRNVSGGRHGAQGQREDHDQKHADPELRECDTCRGHHTDDPVDHPSGAHGGDDAQAHTQNDRNDNRDQRERQVGSSREPMSSVTGCRLL